MTRYEPARGRPITEEEGGPPTWVALALMLAVAAGIAVASGVVYTLIWLAPRFPRTLLLGTGVVWLLYIWRQVERWDRTHGLG